MAFTIGQIVELLDARWLRTPLQNGDRGTITGLVPPRVTVLWDRIDRETFMTENRLRIYVPRVTQRVSSVNVLLALQTVLREEQPHAITELRRDLAEARGVMIAMMAQVAGLSHRYDALRLEHSDLLNLRDSVVDSLTLGYDALTVVLNSDAGTAPPSGALQSAAIVMNAAITELRDDNVVSDADDGTDEDIDDDTDE